jgi:F-type H+-transporting ATPase subunit epsilon
MAATLEVKILSADEVLFAGRAQRVVLPGEHGVFEVCPFHRPLVSRLLPGHLLIDDHSMAIDRGVVKVLHDTLTAIVEPA